LNRFIVIAASYRYTSLRFLRYWIPACAGTTALCLCGWKTGWMLVYMWEVFICTKRLMFVMQVSKRAYKKSKNTFRQHRHAAL